MRKSRQENAAIGAILVALFGLTVWGSVLDLRLVAKAERQASAADVIHLAAGECEPAPAMVYSYPGCASKPYRTHLYYTARLESLALD